LNFQRDKLEHKQKWAARVTVTADGFADFIDMQLLPATALSVPILAHSHLSRDYRPTILQRSQAAIAIYIFSRLFFSNGPWAYATISSTCLTLYIS
jgi:hypothetical protein